jgi:hypothetical protein
VKTPTGSLLAVCALALAACANSPAALATMSPEKLAQQNSQVLCHALGVNNSKKARQELERRQIFTAEEWQLINSKTVGIGMSELALVCTLGTPIPGYGTINTSVSAAGTTRQYVYRHPMLGTRYVYVSNGVVTSYSN